MTAPNPAIVLKADPSRFICYRPLDPQHSDHSNFRGLFWACANRALALFFMSP